MKYNFVGIQFALFFKNPLRDQPDELSVGLRAKLNILENSIIIPIPFDVPPEIPFLQLLTSKNTYQCNVSRGRADFFYNVDKNDLSKDFPDLKQHFSSYINDFFTFWRERKILIDRIGYIARFFIEEKNPALLIKNKFISKNLGDDLTELNISFNKRKGNNHLKWNDIIQLKQGELKKANDVVNGIYVFRDINSLKTEDYVFDQELFNNFIGSAEMSFSFAEIKKIIE